ncbi:dipeptide ABC transporter ATP-binding protein [Pseudomonas sp. 21LCFQ02]|uniref:ABC transporter ATP-binding protein n=1 Tax=Pseudomonas sp. 21LCFQ02 TaxID=2957505 RepID=UPI00209AC705|nr:dipeptide ABC transporter ATP-binding protein [Pseudomonas sp. 21LCFQ02]MCO8170951.1 dipeptide ABC transporter ATP-binding protein [Pseudomonas sp. 21LCFQ02]
MPDNLIEIRDLHVSFADKPVVRGINLHIRRGECLALVGESGSGKSVTAHSILQLLPTSTHLQGSVRLHGEELLGAGAARLRGLRGNQVAMIFQEPMSSLNPLHTVERQIGEALRLHTSLDGHGIARRTLELLEQVGIQHAGQRLKAYPHQLSGGQRQRVMIAMALACEPQLLIADEPTTALDVTVQRKILQLLKDLQQQLGMALLLISHDLNLVQHIAQRVAVMRDGEIVEQADCQTLFNQPAHEYTRQLLDAEPGHEPLPVSDAPDLLQVENLSVRFALGGRPWRREYLQAVQGIDLSVRRGTTLGIVGESGSGKSTLGQAILGLVESQGSISFAGSALQHLDDRQMRPWRKRMQIVFQDPYGSLSPRMSVQQIIAEGLRVHTDLNPVQQDAAVIQALEEVGLNADMRHRYPHEFSGGQRQRIAIARVLVLKPELIVLDEPTSALDRTVQKQIIDLLLRLQHSHGLTYLFISHDLAVVRALAHELLVMKDGQVLERGATRQVFEAPTHPYTRQLMAAAFTAPG